MRLRWSPQAADDLEQIAAYLHREHPSYAQETLIQLYKGLQSLKKMPLIGRLGRKSGTRELLYLPLPYVAIYRVEDAAVIVLAFRHLSQDHPIH